MIAGRNLINLKGSWLVAGVHEVFDPYYLTYIYINVWLVHEAYQVVAVLKHEHLTSHFEARE